MESRLEDDESSEDDIPRSVDLTLNVYVTRTVNVDESTFMLSPKVLDRANVIEFNDVHLHGSMSDEWSEGAFALRPDVTGWGRYQRNSFRRVSGGFK